MSGSKYGQGTSGWHGGAVHGARGDQSSTAQRQPSGPTPGYGLPQRATQPATPGNPGYGMVSRKAASSVSSPFAQAHMKPGRPAGSNRQSDNIVATNSFTRGLLAAGASGKSSAFKRSEGGGTYPSTSSNRANGNTGSPTANLSTRLNGNRHSDSHNSNPGLQSGVSTLATAEHSNWESGTRASYPIHRSSLWSSAQDNATEKRLHREGQSAQSGRPQLQMSANGGAPQMSTDRIPSTPANESDDEGVSRSTAVQSSPLKTRDPYSVSGFRAERFMDPAGGDSYDELTEDPIDMLREVGGKRRRDDRPTMPSIPPDVQDDDEDELRNENTIHISSGEEDVDEPIHRHKRRKGQPPSSPSPGSSSGASVQILEETPTRTIESINDIADAQWNSSVGLPRPPSLKAYMHLNGESGGMTAIRSAEQLNSAASGNKQTKRARPQGLPEGHRYDFQHFFLGEAYIPGPHQAQFVQNHNKFTLHLKIPTAEEPHVITIDSEDVHSYVSCAEEVLAPIIFSLMLVPDCAKDLLLQKIVVPEYKYDSRSHSPLGHLVGIMGKGQRALDFITDWRRFCKKLKTPNKEILDQNGVNGFLTPYERALGAYPGSHRQTLANDPQRAAPEIKPATRADLSASTSEFYAPLSRAKQFPRVERASSPLPNIPRRAERLERGASNQGESSMSTLTKRARPGPARRSEGQNQDSVPDDVPVHPRTRGQTQREKDFIEEKEFIENNLMEKMSEQTDTSSGPRNRSAKPKPSWTVDSQLLRWPMSGPGAIQMFRSDLDKLDEGEFLNDTLIEFGLKYLLHQKEREAHRMAAAFYLYSSFLFKRLTDSRDIFKTYENVRKWTGKHDVFEKDYLVLPMNEHLHWYLAIITHPSKILKRRRRQDFEVVNPLRRSARGRRSGQTLPDDDEASDTNSHGSRSLSERQHKAFANPRTNSEFSPSPGPEKVQRSAERSSSEESPIGDLEPDNRTGASAAQIKHRRVAHERLEQSLAESETLDEDGRSDVYELESNSSDCRNDADSTEKVNSIFSAMGHPGIANFFNHPPGVPIVAGPEHHSTPPPQATARRANNLLNPQVYSPSEQKIHQHLDQSPNAVSVASPIIEIRPSNIDLVGTAPHSSDTELQPMEGIEQSLGQMQVQSDAVDSVGSAVGMDLDEEDIQILVADRAKRAALDAVLAEGTNAADHEFDENSCIRNSGRGTLVGGSGPAPHRIPETIKPGQPSMRSPRVQSGPIEIEDADVAPPHPPRPSSTRPVPRQYEGKASRADVSNISAATRSTTIKKKTREYNDELPTIIFFDSLSASHRSASTTLSKYLRLEALDKKRDVMEKLGITWEEDNAESKKAAIEQLPDCNVVNAIVPEQPNSCDCGVYLLHFFRQFLTAPRRFEDLIVSQHREGVPYRASNVSSKWDAEEGPKQRKFWHNLITKLSSEWEEKRKEEEAKRAQDKKERQAEERAAEAASADKPPVDVRPQPKSTETEPSAATARVEGQAETSTGRNLRPRISAPLRGATEGRGDGTGRHQALPRGDAMKQAAGRDRSGPAASVKERTGSAASEERSGTPAPAPTLSKGKGKGKSQGPGSGSVIDLTVSDEESDDERSRR
ncbi:hypothetical protein OC846_000904 [Tilletia horrida]|uniref:Ubiquitin-like protease family profile domain-containing protein n=1 Tax=Tilletia horrida TaxID=155126 RepID=A0AAN6JTJ1_9BASI|nr:hypothetical protein OC846_000904 [Tilletia horrida]